MDISTQPFRFLDLSPELRNTIYSLLLQSPKAIIFKEHNPLPDYDTTLYNHNTTAYFTRHKILPTAESSFSPNILATNHQIHSEATSIFYGSNRFRFDEGQFPLFLASIGGSFKHIRDVELMGERTKKLDTANFVALKKAGGIPGKLRLGPRYRKYFTVEKMAKTLGALVRAQLRLDGEMEVGCVVERLVFSPAMFARRKKGDGSVLILKQREVREAEVYGEEVKARLLEMLK
jgi:hypothetical protein